MTQFFEQLALPQREIYHGKEVWCVYAKAHDNFYLLNDESDTLADVLLQTNPEILFHFESGSMAHHYACEYYNSHKEIYPYFDEYTQINIEEKRARQADDNCSRHMTFNS